MGPKGSPESAGPSAVNAEDGAPKGAFKNVASSRRAVPSLFRGGQMGKPRAQNRAARTKRRVWMTPATIGKTGSTADLTARGACIGGRASAKSAAIDRQLTRALPSSATLAVEHEGDFRRCRRGRPSARSSGRPPRPAPPPPSFWARSFCLPAPEGRLGFAPGHSGDDGDFSTPIERPARRIRREGTLP